jgi:hypothetical protein
METMMQCMNSGKMDMKMMCTFMDCMEMCQMCANCIMRMSPMSGEMCAMCAEMCTMCATMCESMGDNPMMKRCAEMCRRCAGSCSMMAKSMKAA